jgi:glycosyltransferase involved in cell wall biosynthesis
MKIVLYTGYQANPYNPNTLNTTGLGGTEQCVLYLAYHLARLNHKVWVVGEVIPGDYDGVKYRTTESFKKEVSSVDTIIAASYIHYLKEFEDFNYKNSILWVHNTDYFTWWNGSEIKNHKELLNHPKLSHIICLTYWHKNKFLTQFPESKNKIQVIGNGIELGSFIQVFSKPTTKQGKIYYNPIIYPKNKNQYIYTSHAERGLQRLLEEWPSILKLTPDATLKIATPEYGLEYFNIYFKELVNNLEGVEFVGTLPRHPLYLLMAESEYWYYPSEYEETFCITALEMLGHKVQPITWECGGLKETLHGFNTKNIDEKINWKLAKEYLYYNNWTYVTKHHWESLLIELNMNLNYFYCLTLQPDNNQSLYNKCNGWFYLNPIMVIGLNKVLMEGKYLLKI